MQKKAFLSHFSPDVQALIHSLYRDSIHSYQFRGEAYCSREVGLILIHFTDNTFCTIGPFTSNSPNQIHEASFESSLSLSLSQIDKSEISHIQFFHTHPFNANHLCLSPMDLEFAQNMQANLHNKWGLSLPLEMLVAPLDLMEEGVLYKAEI